MFPRTINKTTCLIKDGQIDVTIIYPQADPAYFRLAHKLAEELESLASNPAVLIADREIMPTVRQTLPDPYRGQTLILLGNLNNNRVLLTPYARYYCFTDALYPGGDGYDLRTMVNPYGKGKNIILAGGSSLQGVERAVDRLIDTIHTAGNKNSLTLPFLLEIELEPSLRRKLYEWPDAPLNVPLPKDLTELLKLTGSYSMMYAATGDPRFGELGGTCLRTVNAQMTDSYGDRHYFIERIMRAIPWLGAGKFLDDADIHRTDELLLGMTLGSQNSWWRMKSAQPPLGHRHHGKGTYEFYLMARFLREQASPEPEIAALCDRWISECQTFLDALGRAGIDDQDDETTMNNLTTIFWYCLSEERYEFFESGGARSWAQRAIALHDNMGAAAGPGGYGETLTGMTFVQEEAATPIASCAFYYQDGRFKWILEHMPRLNPPLRGGFWAYCPIFIHKFDTGPELEPCEPEGLTGLQVLPTTQYQFDLNNNPPQHYEYSGHMVNAPENWLSPEGVGANHLPREKGFDKVVTRGGYQWEDSYLVLQGYQGGFRWQGHMNASNCIIRFSQGGHIFLMQNTREHSQYYKNGVLVSDGFNDSPMPPIAEWLAADDFTQAGMSVTRLNDYHHTAWNRHLFWAKGQKEYYVVMDRIVPEVEGDYSAICTWRTLIYASMEGRTWQADQGDHRFTLRTSEALTSFCEEERDLGAANPYVLHQVKGGHYRQGEPVTFQNIFYVRSLKSLENIDLRRLGDGQAIVLRNGIPAAWIVASLNHELNRGLGLEIQALSGLVTPESILLAGAKGLVFSCGPGWEITSDNPLGLNLDFNTNRLIARIDGPACKQATLRIVIDGKEQLLAIQDQSQIEIDLPGGLCRQWAAMITAELAKQEAQEIAPATWPKVSGDLWKVDWDYDHMAKIPERIREMTIHATPPPTDGIPEQVIDTVPLEIREIWQLWPQAQKYQMTLTFPRERAIESLNLIGDSKDEPLFRVFSPLPSGTKVDASNDGFEKDIRPCPVDNFSGEVSFRRYRGILDRLEKKRVNVGQTTRQIRVTIPSPEEGKLFAFQEIEVFGSKKVLPGICHLLSVDLEGSGHPRVIVVTNANELIVLDEDGAELWHFQCSNTVSTITCIDMLGDGRQYICVGLLSGNLDILSPDGKLWKHLELAARFFARTDFLFGWFYSINNISVWERDARGHAALVLGCYSTIVFLDTEGEIIGHSYVDGPWAGDILITPQGEPGMNDLWVRCGWNHGIGRYEGKAGFEPSGEDLVFGGMHQPMFRALRKIIPFVNGRTAAFEWFTGNNDLGRVIVTAAEDGLGLFSTRNQNFLWKVEGGTAITACLTLNRPENEDEIIIGGVDGFIAAFRLADGKPLRRWWAKAPVVGLAILAGDESCLIPGRLIVATQQGVWRLDENWQPKAYYPLESGKIRKLDERSVLVACKDGTLKKLVIGA
jgi:hypothetical protein